MGRIINAINDFIDDCFYNMPFSRNGEKVLTIATAVLFLGFGLFFAGHTIHQMITDDDGDGYTLWAGDCRDDVPGIHPDGTEDCNDKVDGDCDGYVDVMDHDCDKDGDGILDADDVCPDTEPIMFMFRSVHLNRVGCSANQVARAAGRTALVPNSTYSWELELPRGVEVRPYSNLPELDPDRRGLIMCYTAVNSRHPFMGCQFNYRDVWTR